ncbi:endo-alpha-N-acetylgalactosaminidase family protein [Clostridium sp.]|uniref:endo-alpha-N-acetylgalactosaminidase family protein n=1 Tax=Clostridium sp. TaxID=1506 RepID=UPI001DD4A6EA|nr:endo-alpha-N-acetylgalactosaminidase family protein [Clostridium sp.]MBS5939619.1 FIVAR domain-containing protein [Clostridium sp.]
MKKKSLNKSIALIIVTAVAIGQIPVSALAETSNSVQVDSIQKASDSYVYNQEYSDFDSNTWTRLVGDGEIKEVFDFAEGDAKGALTIKRNAARGNNLVFVEDQSPELKDFEAETRFKFNAKEGELPGRFGIVFRGTNATSYGFVGYNTGTGWLIESPNAWKDDIVGPKIESNEWVTMNVKVKRNNLTLTVNGEEIFNDIVSINNFPQEAGKFGFRTWYDNKDIAVDYLKIKELDSEVKNDITSVTPINIETLVKAKPELPYKVNVTYEDGATGEEVVIWDYVDPSSYDSTGTFTVEGKIRGASDETPKAVANITVREKIYYESNFDTPETSGDWKVLKPTGLTATVSNGSVKIPMNGVSLAYDNKAPNIKNFTYETDFSVNSDTGRIGLGFRIQDSNNWGAVCYDAGSWVWKAAKNGAESYGAFPGSTKIEANKNYKLKLKVEDSSITLWINDELVGSTSTDKIPNGAGKIGLSGWFANKIVTLDNVKVEEITSELEGELPEVQVQSIESDDIKVNLDNTFPRIIDYVWKADNSNLIGQEDRYNKVKINGENYSPEVTCVIEDNTAKYTLAIEEIGVTLNLNVSVVDNKVRMEITDIKEEGDFKVKKVSLPNNSFATVKSNEGGAIAGVLSTGAWHQITDEISTVEDLEPSLKNKTYAFMNDDNFAITMNNNVIEYSRRILLNTQNKNGYKATSMGAGEWTYREVLEADTDLYAEDTLWAEAIITKDMNSDGKTDWQDAAIEYRNNVDAPMGGDMIKDSLSYIAFNIGYTQSPFLRTLDTVKKLYNYTDGFGQMVLEKGYQAEGHDDSIPDYGGHIGIRQGGVEDFNTLINEGAKYNAKFGVHVNATEYQLDAFQYPDGIVNEKSPGWGWLDQAYYVDQRADLVTGELFKRLDSLKSDVPDLGWVYVDVYTGNGWNAHQLGEKLNDLGYPVATEFHSPLEEHVIWNHWGSDPAYPNEGGTSDILRFIRNSTKDGFLSNPLLKGSKHLLSNGWGNNHSIEGVNGVERFYNQVLPTKYMQHFDIMKMTEDEVVFNEGLRAIREGSNINYYKNDRLVATTPENTINSIGEGKTTLFLPWNPVEEDEKIYHWNPMGTKSEWQLPESWGNLKNVELYELSDLGRTKVETIKVSNGKVNLDVKQNTPYLVTKGEVSEDRIDSWGEASKINDPGFDSQTWDYWNKESESGNTDHMTLVNETINRRKGNDVASIGNKHGKISQDISGLEEGKTYSLSAWVKNSGNREVVLGVDLGDKNLNNIITRGGRVRQGEGVKWLDDTYVRMEVEFTVPENVDTANIYVEARDGGTPVLIDDFRIWEHPGHTNKDGYVFYEDFENVDEGITPFFLAPGRGTSNRTHLAEKDLYGRQKMNWVLDGRFSLKSNQQDREIGEMIVTDSSTLKLEPNTTYELGFLYSLANAAPGYSIKVKSLSGGALVDIPLAATDIASGQYTNAKSITKTFTTESKDDYYISLDKGAGFKEIILDNMYVKEIHEDENPTLKYVNLNTILNEIPVDLDVDFTVNALMSNGANVDLSNSEVKYVISDESVISIEDGKIRGLKDGKTTLSVEVTVDGNIVNSNIVNMKVGNGGDEETPEEVDKTVLGMVIDYAEEVKANGALEDVVPAVIKEFEEALEEAKAIFLDRNASESQVDIATNRLINIIHMLDFKQGDKTELIKLVEIITALDENKYTTSSWEALQVELEKANKVIADENAMEEEVAKTYESLNKAFTELELAADKSKLEKLVSELEAKDLSKYTTGSVNNFKIELDNAKAVLNNKDATQEEINEAYNKLIKAYLNLRLIPDKSKLEDLINKAESIDESKYTKESVNKLSAKIKEVKSVLNNEEATQKEVDEATKGLELAFAGLELAQGNNSENNQNGSNNDNDGIKEPGKGNNSNDLPNTGGTSPVAVGLFGTILSLLGAFMAKRKDK